MLLQIVAQAVQTAELNAVFRRAFQDGINDTEDKNVT